MSTKPATSQKSGPRPAPKKESFYAMVSDPTDPTHTIFTNISDHINRPWPFAKPKATCAVRVGPSTVSFTMLMLTNRTTGKITAAPVTLPRGPLSKLERHATRFADLDTQTIAVESGDATITFQLDRDENKVASLTLKSIEHKLPVVTPAPVTEEPGELDALFEEEVPVLGEKEGAINDDGTFELPKASVQLAIFLRSPRLDKYTLALGFIHHFGKAGDTETIGRVVAKSLSLATQLADFRLLSGIESVEVPPAPNRANYSKARAKKAPLSASGIIDIQLFQNAQGPEAPTLIIAGALGVEIDLAHLNQASGKLLFQYKPDANLAPHFELYRSITDSAITDIIRERVGLELNQILDEIILGMVSSTSVEMLKNALKNPGTLNLTPTIIQHVRGEG